MASGPGPTESTPLLREGERPKAEEINSAVDGSVPGPEGDETESPSRRRSWASQQKADTGPKNFKQWGRDKMKKALRTVSNSYRCYSLQDAHCTLDTNAEGLTTIAGYEVQKLTTMRVFFVSTGTVLESPLLWIEMAVIGLIYFCTFFTLMHYRWQGFSQFVGSDTDVRAFISMFSTLIGLLLSFYTSLNIGRWWSLRTCGVEGIAQGASKLTILLSQGVTRDPQCLDAVQRYAIASLMLFFLKDESDVDQLDKLVNREVLSEDEANQLGKLEDSTCYPEALWVWLANIVTQCNEAGLVKGPPHYCALLGAVDEGRTGAATIKTFLDTPIPMGYVHLLGLMVKLHNVILAILMALVSVKHAGRFDAVSTGRAIFRCFFIPLLYNAILIINDELTDPFGHDISDFPAHIICRRLQSDVQSFVEIGDNLPDWIQKLDLKSKKV